MAQPQLSPELERTGGLAEGWLALGRALLDLEATSAAREALERAWASGVQDRESQRELRDLLGELSQRESAENRGPITPKPKLRLGSEASGPALHREDVVIPLTPAMGVDPAPSENTDPLLQNPLAAALAGPSGSEELTEPRIRQPSSVPEVSEAPEVPEAPAFGDWAAQFNPNTVSAWVQLAQNYERAGEPNEARHAYQSALRLEPGHVTANHRLGALLLRLGRRSEAVIPLAKAVASEAAEASALTLLSAALQPSDAPSHPKAASTHTQPPALHGRIGVFQIEDVLELLGHRRATGRLSLEAQTGKQAVLCLYRGRLVEATLPEQESLRSEVLKQKLIDPRALRRSASRSDSGVARTLLDSEMEPSRVEALCRKRLEVALEAILGWKQGEFSFEADPVKIPPAFDFSHQELLMTVLARMDEETRDLST